MAGKHVTSELHLQPLQLRPEELPPTHLQTLNYPLQFNYFVLECAISLMIQVLISL